MKVNKNIARRFALAWWIFCFIVAVYCVSLFAIRKHCVLADWFTSQQADQFLRITKVYFYDYNTTVYLEAKTRSGDTPDPKFYPEEGVFLEQSGFRLNLLKISGSGKGPIGGLKVLLLGGRQKLGNHIAFTFETAPRKSFENTVLHLGDYYPTQDISLLSETLNGILPDYHWFYAHKSWSFVIFKLFFFGGIAFILPFVVFASLRSDPRLMVGLLGGAGMWVKRIGIFFYDFFTQSIWASIFAEKYTPSREPKDGTLREQRTTERPVRGLPAALRKIDSEINDDQEFGVRALSELNRQIETGKSAAPDEGSAEEIEGFLKNQYKEYLLSRLRSQK